MSCKERIMDRRYSNKHTGHPFPFFLVQRQRQRRYDDVVSFGTIEVLSGRRWFSLPYIGRDYVVVHGALFGVVQE